MTVSIRTVWLSIATMTVMNAGLTWLDLPIQMQDPGSAFGALVGLGITLSLLAWSNSRETKRPSQVHQRPH